ncbi:MAG: DUF1648 domain-containing protein [Nanoarchaeota archaeon]|nr:DUF1648 domain-containing protein [Nanoarchaeota archaeon]MBU1005004.1 DUF1648 domain-containing protein [Nanoarchaeota archaeon]MBU1945896.1 DUF1648 domain-containing protein [Nanoarchaeota archaeon]
MKFQKKELIPFAIVLVLFIVSFYLYPTMPEKMPTHWNAKGEIDGYGNRFMGLFLIPMILLAILIVFLIIPQIEVYRKNIESFKDYFYGFKIVFLLFFVVIYTAALLPNFGIDINMNYIIIPALAVLFYYVGYILKFTKRNFFIGIRTPWTLSSEKVWDKTHQLGSKLFKAFSIIILSSLFFKNSLMWFVLAPIIALIVILFVYSYLEYKKIKD